MNAEAKVELITRLIDGVSRLVPEMLKDPVEQRNSAGNAALCVIDADGSIRGKIYGSEKARGRNCFNIATKKVGQVWMTGYATGRFEELIYAKKLDETTFAINRPDYIGWLGGVPLTMADGTPLAAAFSGFSGENDVEIIVRAVANIPGLEVSAA